MPNVRWWELEDRRTNFGGIRAGTTDVPLLLLAEFGLVYGNDWSVIPWNLPVGTLGGCPAGLSFIGWAGGDEALLDLAGTLSRHCGMAE